MTEYTSDIKRIPFSAERVFAKLSDLSNLESVRPALESKVKEFRFDQDSCSFKADPVGTIEVRIVEREPFKTVKLASVKSPVDFQGWIQLKEGGPEETFLKLTFRADIPIFLRAMVSGKLEEGIATVADLLARMSY